MALETLTHDHFAPLAGQVFQSGDVALTLESAKVLGHQRADASRVPFSLTFRGPTGQRVPQGTYQMSHETLGELEIFISQVGDGPMGSEFEAIFT